MAKKISWILLAFMAIVIGLYPALYLAIPGKFGLLQSKPETLLKSPLWSAAFYTHILFGGLALLVGWPQFSLRLRTKRPGLHRNLGRIYIVAAVLSAVSGMYIGLFANGGIISSLGFVSLGIIWACTTAMAYIRIRQREVRQHQLWMVYSYAACCAAITLRLWLPLLVMLTGDFYKAYTIVAWLCWAPNMLVAYFLCKRIALRPIPVT